MNRDEDRTFDEDRLFRSEKARKAYRKFRELAVLKNDEVSLSFLYRFDVVMTQTVDTFASCTETYIGHARGDAAIAAAPIGSEASKGTGVKKYSRGGTIPRDSAQDLKWILPIAATNLTQSCYSVFTQEVTACGVDVKKSLFVDILGGTSTNFKNDLREHSICSRITSNAHFYVAVTVHSLSSSIVHGTVLLMMAIFSTHILELVSTCLSILDFCQKRSTKATKILKPMFGTQFVQRQ